MKCEQSKESKVDWMSSEVVKMFLRESRGRGGRRRAVCVESFPYLEEEFGKQVLRDWFPVDPDPFSYGAEMGRCVQPNSAVPFFVSTRDDIVITFLFLVAQLADSAVAKVSSLDESFSANPLDKRRGRAFAFCAGDMDDVECV